MHVLKVAFNKSVVCVPGSTFHPTTEPFLSAVTSLDPAGDHCMRKTAAACRVSTLRHFLAVELDEDSADSEEW